MYWWEYGATGTFTHSVGNIKWKTILERGFQFSVKLKILIMKPSSFTRWYLLQSCENTCSYKYLYWNIHGSFTHDNSKLEPIQMSTASEWIHELYWSHTIEYYKMKQQKTVDWMCSSVVEHFPSLFRALALIFSRKQTKALQTPEALLSHGKHRKYITMTNRITVAIIIYSTFQNI
jgi:hypothetical protein